MSNEQTVSNKKIVWEYWGRARGEANDLAFALQPFFTPDCYLQGPEPINRIEGFDGMIGEFYGPLLAAFPNLRREPYILLGGDFRGDQWVSGTGNFRGTFAADWLGIPATGGEVSFRFGEFCRLDRGKITAVYIILDIPELMRKAGFDLIGPRLGDEGDAEPPAAGDGILLAAQDEAQSLRSLKLVEAMIAGLMEYDGSGNLDSMGQERFWDVDHMRWYGPEGIGNTRGLAGFQEGHQRPFLTAFGDRVGGNHVCRHSDGLYVASTGWPSINASFGAPYKELPGSDAPLTMRVMDWWRRDGDRLLENWVFIDMIDLYKQAGIDLFERLEQAKEKRHG